MLKANKLKKLILGENALKVFIPMNYFIKQSNITQYEKHIKNIYGLSEI